MQIRSLSRLLLVASVFALPYSSVAQITKPLPLHDAVQDKDFLLLSYLQADPRVRNVLASDKNISLISAERQRFLSLALKTCKGNAVCTLKPLIWTEEEIRAVSFALARSYADNPALRGLVDGQLRQSGAYVLYQNESGADLLVNAWEVCARGLNDVISVYGQGVAPRYPLIDSISFDVNSADFQQHVASLTQQIVADTSAQQLFFEPSLKAALQLLN